MHMGRIPERRKNMRFIFGKLNAGHTRAYAWKVPDGMSVSVGDYALVENMGAFDLVKVCAIAETEKEYEKHITGWVGGIHKYVLATITAEALIHLSQKARVEE